MKKILCFGDSNTWGFVPGSGKRFDSQTRWPSVLQALFENTVKIVEAGCCNRTAFIDNPDGIEQTGYKILPKYLDSSYDIVILALGINDLQFFFKPSDSQIKNGIAKLIEKAQKLCPNADIILMVPAVLTDDIFSNYFKEQFNTESIIQSQKVPEIFKQVAEDKKVLLFNLNDFVKVSEVDGLHFSADSHKKIAKELYLFLKQNFNI